MRTYSIAQEISSAVNKPSTQSEKLFNDDEKKVSGKIDNGRIMRQMKVSQKPRPGNVSWLFGNLLKVVCISRAHLERLSNFSKLGQVFVLCDDATDLQMHASKDAEPELRHSHWLNLKTSEVDSMRPNKWRHHLQTVQPNHADTPLEFFQHDVANFVHSQSPFVNATSVNQQALLLS